MPSPPKEGSPAGGGVEGATEVIPDDLTGTTPGPRSVRARLMTSLPVLTVEPALLLLTFAMMLTGPVMQNLVSERFCLQLVHNSSVCTDLPLYPELEKEVQPRATLLFMSKQLIEALLPAILSFFVGPWSDVYGRRPLLLAPLLGHALQYLGLLFWSLPFTRTWPVNTVLLTCAPVALSGGFVAFVTGAFCLVTDLSGPEERAWRMGVAEAALLVGLPLGLASSSFLLAAGGYQVVFGVSTVASVLGFLYVWRLVPETVVRPPALCHPLEDSGSTLEPAGAATGEPSTSLLTSLRALLDLRLLTEMVRTCTSPRPGMRRAVMFLTMATLASAIFTLDGEVSVVFMYTREKFEWTLREYSIFSSVAVVIATLGTLVGLHVLSKLLRLPDAPLAAFAFLTKAVSATTLALAPRPWVLYLGCVFAVLGGLAAPLGRTILSKSVPKEDIGKVFSLASSLDALTPIAAAPLYTLVYNETLNSMPGAFFLISAAIFVLDVILLCIVSVIHYKFPTENYSLLVQDDSTIN